MTATATEPREERDVMDRADWLARGAELFGPDPLQWRFRCVRCGHEQSGHDFVDAGMPPAQAMTRVFYSCIGRVVDGVGCNWSLGGLFQLHTREVIDEDGEPVPVFRFAGEVA